MVIVLANADGTVYHRYGGRTDISPMSMTGLLEIMEGGLTTHRLYADTGRQAKPDTGPPIRIGELVENRLKGKMNPVHGCYHCHYVREAKVYLAAKDGTWTPDQFWVWPSPKRLGLVMDQERQYLVREVIENSPAGDAGIKAGDVLTRLGENRILSKYDIQGVLEDAPPSATTIPWEVNRGNKVIEGMFHLDTAWKVGDPAEYAWRVRNVFTQHMRKILPTPGVAGDQLPAQELRSLGLEDGQFALRVTGLNGGTYLAGLREGDIILGVGNDEAFQSLEGFYRYCELRRLAGKDIRISLLRGSSSMKLMVNLNYLNYSSIAESPEVVLGFIPQELAGDRGLRVGNVVEGSNAEETGLKVGDRIELVDNEPIRTFIGIERKLDNKAPGEILTLQVRRDEHVLQFAYVLMDKISTVSEIAHLSAPVTTEGQVIQCEIEIGLEDGKYSYSSHKKSLGLPTRAEFRGQGYTLEGPLLEPPPARKEEPDMSASWIHKGKVRLTQVIRVTDPERFQLILRVYAQICDETTCHEFTDIVVSDGRTTELMDYQGVFESAPPLPE